MRAKLITRYSSLSIPAFLNRLNTIAACAKDTTYFPANRPAGVATAAMLAKMASQYAAACVAAESGDKTAIAARNALRKQIEALHKALAHYYEMLANGNLEALQSTGFDLQRQPVKSEVHAPPAAPVGMKVTRGGAGTAIVHASKDKNASHYKAQVTTGDTLVDTNWGGTVECDNCDRIVLTGLTHATRYCIRLAAFGKGGWGPCTVSTPIVIE